MEGLSFSGLFHSQEGASIKHVYTPMGRGGAKKWLFELSEIKSNQFNTVRIRKTA